MTEAIEERSVFRRVGRVGRWADRPDDTTAAAAAPPPPLALGPEERRQK